MAAMKTPSPEDLLCFLTRLDHLCIIVELLSVEKKAPLCPAPAFDYTLREADHTIGATKKFYCVLKQRVDHTCVRVLEKSVSSSTIRISNSADLLSLKLSFVL